MYANPNIGNFYRLTALVAMPNVIGELTQEYLDQSPLKNEIEEDDVIAFVGDLIEASFRDEDDKNNQHEKVLAKHAKKWKLSRTALDRYYETLKGVVMCEVPLCAELVRNRELMSMMKIKSHCWFDNWGNITGPRSILHVHRLLQTAVDLVSDDGVDDEMAEWQRNYFGPTWNERTKPAKKIPHDLDDFLMSEVLRIVFDVAAMEVFDTGIPRDYELIPILPLSRQMLKNRDKPVPLALTFTFHCLLCTILELQGDGDVEYITTSATVSDFVYACVCVRLCMYI
jgi:hypothetical protein